MSSSRPAQAILTLVVRVAGALLAVLPFSPVVLHRLGLPTLAALAERPWLSMCHRMPERSLAFLGEVMPLCSRCLGLVVGMGLGLLVGWPNLSLRALRITVSLACAFLFLELTTQDLGWHPVFHPTRLLSGFLVSFPIGAAVTVLVRKLGEHDTPSAMQPSAS